jgi:hypothetical protein
MARPESKREYERKKRKEMVGFKHWGVVPIVQKKPEPEELRARLAEIPPDTRDLTALIFGDPIPGRRALDRRQSAWGM